MTDFDQDDVAAMRQQGDLRAFMSQQIADGEMKRDSKPLPAPSPRPPGYVAGVWPPGTQSPGPPSQHPAAAWQAALAEFREWTLTAVCPACQVEPGVPCHDRGRPLHDGAVHPQRTTEAERTAPCPST